MYKHLRIYLQKRGAVFKRIREEREAFFKLKYIQRAKEAAAERERDLKKLEQLHILTLLSHRRRKYFKNKLRIMHNL